jgi:3-hydroxyisobutyrate dehydrogenase
MNIGFIGLGHMGNPMAANLIRAGYDLTVHDARRATSENLLASGAEWADSPRAAAQAAQVVITSLPGPAQVEVVLLGAEGVLAGLKPGSTWIDMSTNSVELVKQIAARAAEQGVHTLEAPVTGAVDGARAGRLSIFVGGDQAVYERHLPVFQAMGKRIFHTGALGTGTPVKLVTNLLWFINAVAIGEGLMLGARCQVDLETLWEAIKVSAGNSWVAEHDVPSIFRGDYDPSFSLDLCCKDLRLTTALGRQVGVPLELGALVEQIFLRAQAQYGGDQGEMHVVKLLEDAVGTRLQVADFKPGDAGTD